MPEIEPFPGILYRIPPTELGRVLAPPYDVISEALQRSLYDRDPRNIVRVILSRTPGDAGYGEAGEFYRGLLARGILAPDPEPALYLLEQAFSLEGQRTVRRGLLARFRAEDPATGSILPHEQTRSAAKEDRYRLLKATRANFSPVFLLFRDRGSFEPLAAEAARGPAALAFEDDQGTEHRLFRVAGSGPIQAFRRALGGARAYIADGHHRYATALRYRDEVGPQGAWTFGYFTPLGAPGLVVLPYHRIAALGPSLSEIPRLLGKGFRPTPLTGGVVAAARAAGGSAAAHAFGFAESGGGALLVETEGPEEPSGAPPSLEALDTYLLHKVVLPGRLRIPEEAVRFVHSLAEAEEAVVSGACRLVILLRPTPVGQIVAVAEAGESMPPKSTFFHPKLPSGLVIHPLAG